MPQIAESKASLRQYAVLKGYNRQVDVVRACEARGFPVPQPVVSAMYRGAQAYPKAQDAIARLFWPAQWTKNPEGARKRVLRLIKNSIP